MTRLRVCRIDQVPEEGMVAFDVDGMSVPVLISRVDGVIHATSGMCPHEDVELEGGCLYDREVMCPGHGYFFDLVTGACRPSPELRLPVYRVVIDADEVWIDPFVASA